jgi:hypothetical protein
MYSRYTKSGTNKVSSKRDIKELPFEEVSLDATRIYNDLVDRELVVANAAAQSEWNRRKVIARVNTYSEESREQEDDSLADFEPLDSIDAELARSFKATAYTEAVDIFVERYAIKECWSWLGSQLLSHLGTYQLPSRVDGKILGKDFCALNIGSNERELGIYILLTKVARGRLMEKQVLPDHTPYCALVPMYMAAQKKFHSVPYSYWDPRGVVDKELYSAMTCDPPIGTISTDELLSIRQAGLSYVSKSAKERGQVKYYNPETYHKLVGIGDSAIGNLPVYARAMLCQIWVAHPKNRNQYMILDPYDWDHMPEPLISSTVISNRLVEPMNAGVTIYKASRGDALPAWDD